MSSSMSKSYYEDINYILTFFRFFYIYVYYQFTGENERDWINDVKKWIVPEPGFDLLLPNPQAG